MKSLFGICLLVIVAFLAGTASGYFFRADISRMEASLLPNAENRARDALAQSLIDPESLQLRNTKFAGELICGEMNSRNRMGGYVGFRRFVVLPQTGLRSVLTADDFSDREAAEITLDELAHISFLIDPIDDEPSRHEGAMARRDWLMQSVVFLELWELCDAQSERP
jgi:hypothetical protein